MESSEIRRRITDILLEDLELIKHRIRFLDSLELQNVDNAKIRDMKSCYEFFSTALSCWNSTRGLDANVCNLYKILIRECFKLVADKLKKEFPNEFPSTSVRNDIGMEPVSFEVDQEARNFVGRSEELETLKRLFFQNEEYWVTIAGMGGIGKSELAKRFAHHLHKEHTISIIWFDGENQKTLGESITRLAKKVLTTPAYSESNEMTNTFCKSMSTIPSKLKRKLVIIDNLDEANEEAVEILINARKREKDCFFLITSRNLAVLNYPKNIIHLDIFPDEDAQSLVLSSVKEETHEDVNRLCELLQNFPLALQQALAYIQQQKLISPLGDCYKISDCLDSFATMKKELLGRKLNLDHNYKSTTLIICKVTMEKIQNDADVGKLAIEILNSIAYIQPDRIHMDLLKQFFNSRNVQHIEKAISLIKTYSLLRGRANLVSIHRLLQHAIQLHTIDKRLEVQRLREITNSIVRILENGKNEFQSIQPNLIISINWRYWDINLDTNPFLNCIRHLVSVWDHNCRHPELISEFKDIPTTMINVLSPFRRIMITYFTKSTDSQFKNTFKPNATETQELESEVASAPGRPEKSAIRMNKLDKIYRRQTLTLTEDQRLTLLEQISYSVICEGCYSSNKMRYAQYFQDFLQLREHKSGPHHESTFPVRWELIQELELDDPEFKHHLETLLEGGRDDKELLRRLKDFGDTLFLDRKFAKASYIFIEWLRCKKGDDSDEVTVAKGKLSIIQYCLGDRKTAFQTLEQILVLRKNIENNFIAMKSVCDTADELVGKQKYKQAIDLYKKVTTYQNSSSYPSPFYYHDWWRYETNQKSATCLIQLEMWQDAVSILENEVRWQDLVTYDHKLVIERDELLKEAKEGPFCFESKAEDLEMIPPTKRSRLET